MLVGGQPVAIGAGITTEQAGRRLEEAGLTADEARAVGTALVDAAHGLVHAVDVVNVVVMVRPGPQALWRRLVLWVLRWVLMLHILMVANLAFTAMQPVESFARAADFAWYGGAYVPFIGHQMPSTMYPVSVHGLGIANLAF